MENYFCFVDESGTPNLKDIKTNNGYFSIGAVVFEHEYYFSHVIPSLFNLKLKHNLKITTPLHSYDIRQKRKDFSFLQDQQKLERFISDLNIFFENLKCKIFISALNKEAHNNKYKDPFHPYLLNPLFLFERLDEAYPNSNLDIFSEELPSHQEIYLKTVDDYLRSEETGIRRHSFVSKSCFGTQVADLIVYSLKEHIIGSCNMKLWEVMKPLVYKKNGLMKNHGIKIFP